jgi:hypothetical protein
MAASQRLVQSTRSTESQSEPEQIVEETDALVQQTLKRVLVGCPEDLLGVESRDGLRHLRPRLQEALRALEDIEACRSLTDKELLHKRVFKILLAGSPRL